MRRKRCKESGQQFAGSVLSRAEGIANADGSHEGAVEPPPLFSLKRCPGGAGLVTFS
jgi:hypothetical protein